MGLVGGMLVLVMSSEPSHAVCRNFEGSHNGTNLFHPTGALGAAINDVLEKVKNWEQENGYKKVRMGKVRTKCGERFMKYLLPHRHCVAKVRACAS